MDQPVANFEEAQEAIKADQNITGWYEFTLYVPTGNGRTYKTQTAKYYKTSDGKLKSFNLVNKDSVPSVGCYKYLGEDGKQIHNNEVQIPIGERSYFGNRETFFGGSKKSKQRKRRPTQKKHHTKS